MFCGSCLRDNALARAVNSLGHEMVLVPTYTPLRLDEESAAGERVFLGAVEVYLQEMVRPLRGRRGLIGRILGSQRVLKWLSRFSLSASPEQMGRLTVSVLRGADGHQRMLVDDLARWLGEHVRPDVVHLTNAFFCGLAGPLQRALGAPVVCGLQGEDIFLDSLPDHHRLEAVSRIAERAADVDRWVATSRYYAERSAELFGLDGGRISVVLSGIRLDDYAMPEETESTETAPESARATARGPGDAVVGYFARIAPEKGLHILAAAFGKLAREGNLPGLKLKAAGYLGGKNLRYAASIRRFLAASGLSARAEILGTLERSDKLAFFRSIDVLAVPTVHPEPKGIFALEAMAAGVPVVLPGHGVFPELIEATGGGLLHEPGNPDDLAEKLSMVLRDPALRRRLGESGRGSIGARFTSRRMAEEMLEVYAEVLKAAGSATAAAAGGDR